MDLRRAARHLQSRVSTMIARGVISRVNDALATQGLQVELRHLEVADDVEHFQPYGLSFRPAVDSEVIVLAIGGAQDHLVGLAATDRATRPTGVEEGEGGLYNPTGWKIFLAADDVVHLGAQSGADFVALAALVKAELDKIQATLGTGTTPTGGPVTFTSPYIAGDVAAQKVKAT